MSINLRVPKTDQELKPRISVIGVGGAGGNAVNNMVRANLHGVEFIAANTDAQALNQSLAERKIQLGVNINHGLGAGAKPEVGKAAAEESADEIMQHIQGSNMVFITAGMGGGTGTGAASVVARLSRELGILTVGVVTKPFTFEGGHRMRLAESGIDDLQQYVDTLIVIPNQNLFRIANERTTFADAFKMADDVLYSGVRGVTDLITMPGLINLDFADIQTVMAEMGKAMMGTGEAEGDRRALDAAEAAINNPLLDDVSMKGARAVLINITGGLDMTLFEVDEAANRIRSEVDPEANIIFGAFFDEKLEGRMRISIVAAGMDSAAIKASSDQRAMNNPFDMRLRPNKVVPHADIIATARKPVPAPQQQVSYSSSSAKFSQSAETAKADSFSDVKQPMREASESGGFIPTKPVETAPSEVVMTDRIVVNHAADMAGDMDASVVSVNLKQERPLEKSMERAEKPSYRPAYEASPSMSPAAKSGYAVSQSDRAPQSSSARINTSVISEPKSAAKRGPGLFERMMGGVLGKDAPAPTQTRQEPSVSIANDTPAAPKPAEKMQAAAETDQPEQLSLAPDSDDTLDIPAFLRRQAN